MQVDKQVESGATTIRQILAFPSRPLSYVSVGIFGLVVSVAVAFVVSLAAGSQ